MLDISDETYRKVLAEEEEYERLMGAARRRQLSTALSVRTWLSGLATLALVFLGLNPRWRPLLLAAAAMVPVFVWQLVHFMGKEKWVAQRLQAEHEDRTLALLAQRQEIRQNILAQKAAQDEISRLKAEIEAMRSKWGEGGIDGTQ